MVLDKTEVVTVIKVGKNLKLSEFFFFFICHISVLVPRGRDSFVQHQESTTSGRSQFLSMRRVLVLHVAFSQSGLSDLNNESVNC